VEKIATVRNQFCLWKLCLPVFVVTEKFPYSNIVHIMTIQTEKTIYVIEVSFFTRGEKLFEAYYLLPFIFVLLIKLKVRNINMCF